MNAEALNKAQKYAKEIRERIASPTPEKHKHREASYRQFLQWELAAVTKKIEAIQLATPASLAAKK